MVLEVNEQTRLIGKDAADIGYEVSLISEKAMSRKISPFRSVNSLANFIVEVLGVENEQNHGNYRDTKRYR
jgi:hypothetical protein